MWSVIKYLHSNNQSRPLSTPESNSFFPFLLSDISIKPYFYRKRELCITPALDSLSDIIEYHISDYEDIKHFLYDIELYYRQSKGNHKIFRQKLIEHELYDLFNILFWTKQPDLTHDSEDAWEILGTRLLSGWYRICEPNDNYTEKEIHNQVLGLTKYTPESFN